MFALLLVLIAVGSASADLPEVLTALELLQHQLENDFKFAQAHAALDLDTIWEDVKKSIPVIMENPGRGMRELAMELSKDVQQTFIWVQQDYKLIREHLQDAIEIIKKEIQPTESPVTTTTPGINN